MNERMKAIFDREDITSQQFNILFASLQAGKPLSTLQIRQRMLDKMSDTSRIVDRLRSKVDLLKWFARDKRLVDVFYITEKRPKTFEIMEKLTRKWMPFSVGWTETEVRTLNEPR